MVSVDRYGQGTLLAVPEGAEKGFIRGLVE